MKNKYDSYWSPVSYSSKSHKLVGGFLAVQSSYTASWCFFKCWNRCVVLPRVVASVAGNVLHNTWLCRASYYQQMAYVTFKQDKYIENYYLLEKAVNAVKDSNSQQNWLMDVLLVKTVPSVELPDDKKKTFHFLIVRARNSFLVLGLSLNLPSMTLVTVLVFIFCTPLITMHMWLKYTEEDV